VKKEDLFISKCPTILRQEKEVNGILLGYRLNQKNEKNGPSFNQQNQNSIATIVIMALVY